METVGYNPKLYEEARKAYFKALEAAGAVLQQPSANASEIGRKYVYLRNVNGLLAKYDIKSKEIIWT